MEAGNALASERTILFPRLIRRVRAVIIDSVFLVILIYAWMLLLPYFPSVNHWIKILAIPVIFFLYEPVPVSLAGGTIGHHIMGIRVRDAKRNARIGMLRSTLRAMVKILLGWFSLVLVLTSARHQAVHDYVCGSLVVLKNPDDLPDYDKLTVRIEDHASYAYPSLVRRILAIASYNVVLFFLLAFVSTISMSAQCTLEDHCTLPEQRIAAVISVAWLAAACATLVLGWKGMLFGARRKRREAPLEGVEPAFREPQ